MPEKICNMKKLDIVIPYIMGPNDGWELRHVLRSIEMNLNTKQELVVWLIGDKPDWCKNVKHVPVERITGMDYMSFYDTINKIYTACLQEDMGPGFVYMYDDTYFIAPTTTKDIYQLKALEDMSKIKEWFKKGNASRKWKNLLKKTLQILQKEEKPIYNYETHTPRYYNKKKALQLIQEYGLLGDPLQFATLYYNNYYRDKKPRILMPWGDGVKLGVYRPFPLEVLKEKLRDNKFLNYDPPSLTQDMKELIGWLFPDKSKYEE